MQQATLHVRPALLASTKTKPVNPLAKPALLVLTNRQRVALQRTPVYLALLESTTLQQEAPVLVLVRPALLASTKTKLDKRPANPAQLVLSTPLQEEPTLVPVSLALLESTKTKPVKANARLVQPVDTKTKLDKQPASPAQQENSTPTLEALLSTLALPVLQEGTKIKQGNLLANVVLLEDSKTKLANHPANPVLLASTIHTMEEQVVSLVLLVSIRTRQDKLTASLVLLAHTTQIREVLQATLASLARPANTKAWLDKDTANPAKKDTISPTPAKPPALAAQRYSVSNPKQPAQQEAPPAVSVDKAATENLSKHSLPDFPQQPYSILDLIASIIPSLFLVIPPTLHLDVLLFLNTFKPFG